MMPPTARPVGPLLSVDVGSYTYATHAAPAPTPMLCGFILHTPVRAPRGPSAARRSPPSAPATSPTHQAPPPSPRQRNGRIEW
eukprot:245158-Prorocentrum_minimum.AAC.2